MNSTHITHDIIGAAIEVHRHWGPGLYESLYEKSLQHELQLRRIAFESQVQLPLSYKGTAVGNELRLDLLVEQAVVVEIKSVSHLEPIHEAQLLTYMRITKCRVGLLINFNCLILKDGIQRLML